MYRSKEKKNQAKSQKGKPKRARSRKRTHKTKHFSLCVVHLAGAVVAQWWRSGGPAVSAVRLTTRTPTEAFLCGVLHFPSASVRLLPLEATGNSSQLRV